MSPIFSPSRCVFYRPELIFFYEILYRQKLPIFKVPEMSKSLTPKERAWKTDQENSVVCYILMKTSRVMKDLKLAKLDKSAESAKICSFQLKISWKVFIEI